MDTFQQPIDVLSPTEAEVASLTSLHPHFSITGAPSFDTSAGSDFPFPFQSFPSLTKLLEEVFQPCHEQWISDFVFNSDMSPLSVLTSPVNASYLSAARVSTISAEKPTSPNCPSPTSYLFDTRMAGEFLFVPAFSVGPITAGFGVVHYSVLCRAEWGRDPTHASRRGECGHIRFVRNDAARSLLIAFDDKKADIIKLDLFDQLSTSVRKRVTLTVRRSKFYHILLQQPVTNLVQAAYSTALMSSYNIERRICTTCTTYSATHCSCSRPPVLPKHSLDFSSMRNNMDIHGGAFDGVSTTALFVDGMAVVNATVGHHLSIEGSSDRNLSSRLGQWAIRDLLQDTRETPFMDYKLAIGIMARYVYAANDNGTKGSDNGTDVKSGHEGAVATEQLGKHYGFNMVNKPRENGNGNDGDSNFFAKAESVQAARAMNYKTSTGFDAYGSTDYTGTAFESPLDDTQALTVFEGFRRSARHDPRASRTLYEGNPDDLDIRKEFDTNADAISRRPCQVPTQLSVDMQNVGAGSAKRQRRSEGSDYSAGSGSTVRATTSAIEHRNKRTGDSIGVATIANVESDKKEREQMIKAELRRKRNREAAQRSNLRRKVRNDTLKHELLASHARAMELRAQEQLLREENLKLRKLLAGVTS